MKNIMKTITTGIIYALAIMPLVTLGETYSVTASRNYVDKRTKLTPVNSGGKTIGYTIGTNTTAVLASTNFVNASGTGGGGSSANKYAMFIIPLDDTWCDFELKASESNFGYPTSYGNYGDMVIHCSSSLNNALPDYYDPCLLFVTAHPDYPNDPREWHKIDSTAVLGTFNPSEIVVIVGPYSGTKYSAANPSGESFSDTRTWCTESNSSLLWSYVRVKSAAESTADNQEIETNSKGVQHWRPISPVRWYSSLPNWATNQDN